MEINSKTKSYNNMSPAPQNPPPAYPSVTPEYPTLIVMIAVLAIILIFCFWGAPGVRDYCRRSVCCHCPMDEPTETSGTPADDRSATPTIILLPFGRMLVVDRNVFTQLQADQTGIDFMELSANLIRAHHLQCGSTPSILDSETTSKGLSPTSLGFSPPSYEDIFGEKHSDLPPSYSELSLLFRQRRNDLSILINANGNELRYLRAGSESRNFRDSQINVAGEDEVKNDRVFVPCISRSFSANDQYLSAGGTRPGNSDPDGFANCRYCIMSFENEKRGRNTCSCLNRNKRPTSLCHSRAFSPSGDNEIKTVGKVLDEACCSSVNEFCEKNVTIQNEIHNETVQINDPELPKHLSTDDSQTCVEGDPKRHKRQKSEGIKESSL